MTDAAGAASISNAAVGVTTATAALGASRIEKTLLRRTAATPKSPAKTNPSVIKTHRAPVPSEANFTDCRDSRWQSAHIPSGPAPSPCCAHLPGITSVYSNHVALFKLHMDLRAKTKDTLSVYPTWSWHVRALGIGMLGEF